MISSVDPSAEQPTSSNYSASTISSPSLDMPFMGPTFDIEEVLREARKETDMGTQAESSISSTSSMSSSFYTSEEEHQTISSISSNETLELHLRGDQALRDHVNPAQTSSTPPLPEQKRPAFSYAQRNLNLTEKPVDYSQEKTRRKREQYLKLKLLPAVTLSPPTINKQTTQHIVNLASKYSKSRTDTSVNKLIESKAQEKTLSQAANELERELKKLTDIHAAERGEQIFSRSTTDQHKKAVTPLLIPSKNDAKLGVVGTTLRPKKWNEIHQRGPSNPLKDNDMVQYVRFSTVSPAQPKPMIASGKEHEQASSPTRTKIGMSVHLPSLRRNRPNNQSPRPTSNRTKKICISSPLGPARSLEDERAALAKSTDCYINAKIAKALNVEQEEEYENAGSIDSKDFDENEWSTMYPLKAVKKLGIPLLTDSHIPRLSYPDMDKGSYQRRRPMSVFDVHNANDVTGLQNSPSSLSSSIASKDIYPETPEDVGVSISSFIKDPSPTDSPTNIGGFTPSDETGDSNKIFVGFDRLKTVFEDAISPNTEEVPLVMGHPTVFHHSRATTTIEPPRDVSIYELDEHGSTPIKQVADSIKEISVNMPAEIPDGVVLSLMKNVVNLDVLFKYAQVNRQFYRVFKDDELSLIQNALFTMNPPAWELREMSPPWSDDSNGLKDPDAPVPAYTPSTYLQHYARDVFALVRLKALIYSRCNTIVRAETIRGLTGEDDVRASEIDEAFWRVWTFCRIFGCGKNREGDLNGQLDWLNAGYLAKRSKSGATVVSAELFFSMNNVLFHPPAGFGDGNGEGLTCDQLYDMLEIWNCLGTLVQSFHRECKDARVAGIFDGLDVAVGDIAKEEVMLEEWTHYLLTLGPSALVRLSTVKKTPSAKELFDMAKQMGVTKWKAPGEGNTRSSFLREAISRAYDNRVAIQRKLSNSPTSQEESSDSSSTGNDPSSSNASTYNSVRASQMSWMVGDDPSIRRAPPYVPYINGDNIAAVSLAGPPPRYSTTESGFIDPVDRAIYRMVNDLGFSERDAIWALKITDTGDMLDINAAIALLERERRSRENSKNIRMSAESRGSDRDECLVDISKHRGTVSWRWA